MVATIDATISGVDNIWISINSGATWTQSSSPVASWSGIKMSQNGNIITAAQYPGGIFQSFDGGLTWVDKQAESNNWNVVTMSADGLKILAGEDYGQIYTFQ